MPWTAKDAPSGLTEAQKKKWARIANAILSDCESMRGKGCEGRAKRIANSKVKRHGR